MKKTKNSLSLYGTIRKYKALAKVRRLLFSWRCTSGTDVFNNGCTSQEKLQIIYANIRV